VLTFGRDTAAPTVDEEDDDEEDDDDDTLTFSRRTGTTADTPPDSVRIGDVRTEMAFLPDVLRPIFSAFRALAEDEGVAFEISYEDGDGSSLPGVTVSPRSLQEAVSNVLDNALKHCKGTVRVTVSSNTNSVDGDERDEKPGVTVLVNDDGPGVPVEHRERVFERGFRGRTDRTGIGLYVGRTLLSRMRGILDVADDASSSSLPGRGPPFASCCFGIRERTNERRDRSSNRTTTPHT